MMWFGKITKKYCVGALMFSVACSVKTSSDVFIATSFKRENYIMYAQKDNYNRRLNMFIKNKSEYPLCVRKNEWPAKGNMDDCVVDKLKISYEQRDIGLKQSWCSDSQFYDQQVLYEVDCCQYRIAPGEVMRGYLKYEDFTEDLSGMRSEQMTLNFPYAASVCEDWKATGRPTPLLSQ